LRGEDQRHFENIVDKNLRSRVDGELQFTLLAVVHTQSLQEKGSEPRSGTSPEGVENKESLKTGALVCQLPESVKAKVDDLFPDSVVATSVVVCCIFLEDFTLNSLSAVSLLS
jgi:hypothetical protein